MCSWKTIIETSKPRPNQVAVSQLGGVPRGPACKGLYAQCCAQKRTSRRRAARRGQGGRLTTLNFRTGAVTTLNFLHVLIFFYQVGPNISRRQTRTYRKSTKEETSGNGYVKEREKHTIVSKKQLVIMSAVNGALCKNCTGMHRM